MSQFFHCDGVTLWNPSNGTARLFLHQVSFYENELALPSGIGPMVDDDAAVDPPVLHAFATALVRWRLTARHPVLSALSDGFVATALVLAERAGRPVPLPDPAAPDGGALGLPAKAGELSRAMTR
ncbi:DUF6086 family protein [Streptomyces sp. B-S-A8]|uniref:DUF6086 family protein n=1 Tax=Streptomyces solicavernae TaxID=3043614 RepID=A0ABT6RU03_9ACTN|nr:DUF6086 family protein [Streptomyces sp. B-S-A8]MDI3387919.1 DUF6086 family protein [Streptomyces sp. B-S-A8]